MKNNTIARRTTGYLILTGFDGWLAILRHALRILVPLLFPTVAIFIKLGVLDACADVAIIVGILLSLAYGRICVRDTKKLAQYIRGAFVEGGFPPYPETKSISGLEEIVMAVCSAQVQWQKQLIQANRTAAESGILFNIAPEPIVAIDRELVIVKANSASHTAFGINIVGCKISDVIRSHALEQFISRELKKSYSDSSFECDAMETMSATYLVALSSFPQPAAVAALVLLRDITEHKNREKISADFIANASHELRTPLTSIYGFVETMIRDDLDQNTRQEFLKIMSGQCARMTSLISDMSKLYAMDLEKKDNNYGGTISLALILEDVIRDFTIQLKEHNIVVYIKKEKSTEPLLINASHEAMYGVVSNLISNAIKYSNRDSVLEINCQVIDDPRKSKPLVRVSFVDQGPGIPSHCIPRLTERFYRADISHSSNISGTGLGLAIVKSTLEKYGGSLEIKSTLNQGSQFTIFLPAVPQEELDLNVA